MKDPPTRDFMRWKPGHFFTDEKFYPVPENQDRVSRKTRTVVSRKTRTVNGTSVPENQDKENGLGVPENQDKSSIPLVGPNGAGPEVGGQVRPPELKGLRVWTTPTLIELPWNDEWARLYCEVVEEPERNNLPLAHATIRHNAGSAPDFIPAFLKEASMNTNVVSLETPWEREARKAAGFSPIECGKAVRFTLKEAYELAARGEFLPTIDPLEFESMSRQERRRHQRLLKRAAERGRASRPR
jgi:hypothetical protein